MHGINQLRSPKPIITSVEIDRVTPFALAILSAVGAILGLVLLSTLTLSTLSFKILSTATAIAGLASAKLIHSAFKPDTLTGIFGLEARSRYEQSEIPTRLTLMGMAKTQVDQSLRENTRIQLQNHTYGKAEENAPYARRIDEVLKTLGVSEIDRFTTLHVAHESFYWPIRVHLRLQTGSYPTFASTERTLKISVANQKVSITSTVTLSAKTFDLSKGPFREMVKKCPFTLAFDVATCRMTAIHS